MIFFGFLAYISHRFEVVTTARSDEKGARIVESVEPDHRQKLSYVVIDDIGKQGAIDAVSTNSISELRSTAIKQRCRHWIHNRHSTTSFIRRHRIT